MESWAIGQIGYFLEMTSQIGEKMEKLKTQKIDEGERVGDQEARKGQKGQDQDFKIV